MILYIYIYIYKSSPGNQRWKGKITFFTDGGSPKKDDVDVGMHICEQLFDTGQQRIPALTHRNWLESTWHRR